MPGAARILVEALKRETDAALCGELASGLAHLVMRLDRATGGTIMSSVAERLRQAAFTDTAEQLVTLAGWIAPVEAADKLIVYQTDVIDSFTQGYEAGLMSGPSPEGVADEPIKDPMRLVYSAEWKSISYLRDDFTSKLQRLIDRMGRPDSACVCVPAAEILTSALRNASKSELRAVTGAGIAVIASGMGPADAGRFCNQASHSLANDWSKKRWFVRCTLAEAIAVLAERIEAGEAAQVCGQASQILVTALQQETNMVGAPCPHESHREIGWANISCAWLPVSKVVLLHKEKPFGSEEDLSALVGQMEGVEVLRLATSAAPKGKDAEIQAYLADGLLTLARLGRMDRRRPCQYSFAVRKVLRVQACAGASRELSRGCVGKAAAGPRRGRSAPELHRHWLRPYNARKIPPVDACWWRVLQQSSRGWTMTRRQAYAGAIRDLFLTKDSEDHESDDVGIPLATARDMAILLPWLDTSQANRLARELIEGVCSRGGHRYIWEENKSTGRRRCGRAPR